MVNFPLCSSSLFVAYKRFESDWHVVSSLTWRRGRQGPLCWLWGTAFASAGEMSTGLCGNGLGTMLWVEPLISIPFKASALGALMGRGVVPSGLERVKKMWLCTHLPCMSVFTKLHFIKRQSHFPDTVTLTFPQGHLLSQRYGFLPWGNNITVPPSCLFYAPALNFCETQCIFFVCLDHEHCIGRLGYSSWQLCVHETLH